MKKTLVNLAVAACVGILGSLAVNSTTLLLAQTPRYEKLGLRYIFPSAHAPGVLASDGQSPVATLSWGSGVQSGTMLYTEDATCPSGWTENTSVRGRYIVGLVSGGTNAGTVATPLTHLQNIVTGSHGHTATATVTLTNPTHDHDPLTISSHAHDGMTTVVIDVAVDTGTGVQEPSATTTNTGSSTSGVTVQNSVSGSNITLTPTFDPQPGPTGVPAGTNAPYLMLMACTKT